MYPVSCRNCRLLLPTGLGVKQRTGGHKPGCCGYSAVPVTQAVRDLPQALRISTGWRGEQGRDEEEGKGKTAKPQRYVEVMRDSPPQASSGLEGISLSQRFPGAELSPPKEHLGSTSSRNSASQHPPRTARARVP